MVGADFTYMKMLMSQEWRKLWKTYSTAEQCKTSHLCV